MATDRFGEYGARTGSGRLAKFAKVSACGPTRDGHGTAQIDPKETVDLDAKEMLASVEADSQNARN